MRRVLVLSAALLAALPAAGAQAAVKTRKKPPPPSCHVVLDPEGDATGVAAGQSTNDSGDTGLDLTGAELATTAGQATVVFRLPVLTTSDVLSPGGREFDFSYVVAGATHTITAVVTPTGTVWGSGGAGTSGAMVDAAKEIHVTVPAAEAGLAGVKPGTVLSALTVTTYRWAGVVRLGVAQGQRYGDPVDVATAGKVTYKHAGPSCIKVGA
jgi:hypothetical protein